MTQIFHIPRAKDQLFLPTSTPSFEWHKEAYYVYFCFRFNNSRFKEGKQYQQIVPIIQVIVQVIDSHSQEI